MSARVPPLSGLYTEPPIARACSALREWGLPVRGALVHGPDDPNSLIEFADGSVVVCDELADRAGGRQT